MQSMRGRRARAAAFAIEGKALAVVQVQGVDVDDEGLVEALLVVLIAEELPARRAAPQEEPVASLVGDHQPREGAGGQEQRQVTCSRGEERAQ
jgi:hypothetical protein